MATMAKQQAGVATTGPHLIAALVCERVLIEKDNVMSVIRIIDRINVTAAGPDAPDEMPEVPLNHTLFLSFKSGAARGPVPVKVTMTLPSGIDHSRPLFEGTIHFEGGVKGHNHVTLMQGNLKVPGPYWLNVYVSDDLVTRTPLEVVYTTSKVSEPRAI